MNSQGARNLTDYIRAALRRRLLLITPALVLALSVAAAVAKLPALYKSSARVSVTYSKPSESSDLSRRLNEFQQQITSRDALQPIAYDTLGDASESTLSQVRSRISIKPDPQSYSFVISTQATAPDIAQKMTERLAQGFVGRSAHAQQTQLPGLEAQRKRVDDISNRLRQLEEKDPRLLASGYGAPAGGDSPPSRNAQPSLDSLRAQQMTIDGLRDQEYKFQQELADIERRIAEQRQIVEQQKKSPGLLNNPTYAALIARRTELQGQRDTLINRQELTDKHPRVLAINDQIAAINRQIDELRKQDAAQASQTPEARELASLESQRNRIKIDLEVTERELARRQTAQSGQNDASTTRAAHREAAAPKSLPEYLALKRSYEEASTALKDAEAMSPESGASPVQLAVVEPANLPLSPASPNRYVLISIAAALGLALGAILAVLVETRRLRSIQDARDVEQYARLPLLAAIPRTRTAAERRRRTRNSIARVVFATTAAAAITLGLTRLLIAADIISIITKK